MVLYELNSIVCLAIRLVLVANVARGVVLEVRRLIVSVIEIVSGPVTIEPKAVRSGRNETVARLVMMAEFICPQVPSPM